MVPRALQVTQRWLPFIRQILGEGHKRPVILVGNKADLVDTNTLDVSFNNGMHISVSLLEINRKLFNMI